MNSQKHTRDPRGFVGDSQAPLGLAYSIATKLQKRFADHYIAPFFISSLDALFNSIP